jgi:hypothetical protein
MVLPGLAAAPNRTSGDAAPEPDHIRLTCTGVMVTPGASAEKQPIVADGLLDLAAMRVRGFGIGSHPIVYLTAARVAFGTAANGDGVEGTIDRLTGATRISVRSPKDPAAEAMSISLDCRMAPPIS